jgi:PRTRC genetic system protein B
MEPVSTIVIYSDKQNFNSDFYAELYPVKDRQLCAGRPLSINDVKGLLAGVNIKYKLSIGHGMLPSNIIHLCFDDGEFSVAWVVAPKKRKIMYSDDKFTGIVNHPRLLFLVKKEQLWIYGLPKGKITNNTKVYESPYDNISNGHLCFGSVPKAQYARDLKKYMSDVENNFYHGEFTHEKFLNYWKNKEQIKLQEYGTIKKILGNT